MAKGSSWHRKEMIKEGVSEHQEQRKNNEKNKNIGNRLSFSSWFF